MKIARSVSAKPHEKKTSTWTVRRNCVDDPGWRRKGRITRRQLAYTLRYTPDIVLFTLLNKKVEANAVRLTIRWCLVRLQGGAPFETLRMQADQGRRVDTCGSAPIVMMIVIAPMAGPNDDASAKQATED